MSGTEYELEGSYKYYEESGAIIIDGVDLGTYISDVNPNGRKLRITIEVLEDEVVEEDEPIIIFTLRQIIRNDDAINGLRLNPYCMNEGADPTARYEIKLSDAKKWGLV